jgi:hypothetical protein
MGEEGSYFRLFLSEAPPLLYLTGLLDADFTGDLEELCLSRFLGFYPPGEAPYLEGEPPRVLSLLGEVTTFSTLI